MLSPVSAYVLLSEESMKNVVIIPLEIWLAFRVLTDALVRLLEEQEKLPLPGTGYIVALPEQRMEHIHRILSDLASLSDEQGNEA